MKNCKNCNKEFNITDGDREFIANISPEINGKKYLLPEPNICFECRLQKRLIHRNERVLYSRKCDAPGHDENLVSMYDTSPDFKVYCQKYWWSDDWDSIDFGIDYDPSRSFFEQFGELQRKVPRISLINAKAENTEFSNYTFGCKSCYMEIGSVESDFCLFSYNSVKCRDCSDSIMIADCENCYELLDSTNCYNVKFARFCDNCRDSAYLHDCISCSDCIGCIGLRNQQYNIFNKKYSKEEYFEKAKQYDVSSFENLKRLDKDANEFFMTFPHEFARLKNCEDVIGNSAENSKKCRCVFDVIASTSFPLGAENTYYSVMCGINLKDGFDIYQHGGNTEKAYSIAGGEHCQNVFFSLRPLDSSNLIYTENCDSCQDCFGCTGLKRKQYCILNKQYTKEEYEKKIDEIITQMTKDGEWGEFFDPSISMFKYNESMAMDYFPKSKEDVLKAGYTWKERPQRTYQTTKNHNELPDNIKQADNNITSELITCESVGKESDLDLRNCSTAFKITPQEFELYKKMDVTLPHKCSNCRYFERIHRRDGIKLYHRKCMNEGCNNEFETPYSPERQEIIFCKSCYQKVTS